MLRLHVQFAGQHGCIFQKKAERYMGVSELTRYNTDIIRHGLPDFYITGSESPRGNYTFSVCSRRIRECEALFADRWNIQVT